MEVERRWQYLDEGPFSHWSLSLHAGSNDPQGAFGSGFGGAWSIGLDLEYRFNDFFALELFLGHDEFAASQPGPNPDVNHLSLNGKAYFGGGPLRPVLILGAGSYDLDPGPTDAGASAGVGLQLNLGPTWAAELTGKYHVVQASGPDLEFVTLHGGVRIRF